MSRLTGEKGGHTRHQVEGVFQKALGEPRSHGPPEPRSEERIKSC